MRHILIRLFVILFVLMAHSLKWASIILKKGNGTSLPGYVIERYTPWILPYLAQDLTDITYISGTNGKTTTRAILVKILRDNGVHVVTNQGGANIMRGVASSLLFNISWRGKTKARTAVFEVEEATLPILARHIPAHKLILTNIFRDQLDAYGEIDKTAQYFRESLPYIKDTLYINSEDGVLQKVAAQYSGSIVGFGIEDTTVSTPHYEAATDSNLQQSITEYTARNVTHNSFELYQYGNHTLTLSHQLPGSYNVYNMLAAISASYNWYRDNIVTSIAAFKPVFGRGETLTIGDKDCTLFLIKNPAGCMEVLTHIHQQQSSNPVSIIYSINDNIADGKDVSWLWDIDFEQFYDRQLIDTLYCTGVRAYDMALRTKYAGQVSEVITPNAVPHIIEQSESPTYLLCTYTAMREMRDILGKYTDLVSITDNGQ